MSSSWNHFLRQLNRIALTNQSNCLSRLGQIRSNSNRPTLTLDDVLPSPSMGSSSSESQSPARIARDPFPQQSRSPSGLASRPSFLTSNFNRRSSIELASDPIRRRPGEKTHYSLIVHSSSNNTRLTLTHTPICFLPGSTPGHAGYQTGYPMAGAVVARVTAGSVGFKRGKRQDYEAATQATLAMFNKIRELINLPALARVNSSPAKKDGAPRELEIVLNGFGIGRDAFMASLLNSQANDLREIVRSLRDSTTVKIGGPRPKKRRRV